MWSFCERDGELRSKEHARRLQGKKKAVRSQSSESANTVSKSVVAYYCSVIIAASFSGFIIQFLMVILGVAILSTSFFCSYHIEMIHKLEGWKARNKSEVN